MGSLNHFHYRYWRVHKGTQLYNISFSKALQSILVACYCIGRIVDSLLVFGVSLCGTWSWTLYFQLLLYLKLVLSLAKHYELCDFILHNHEILLLM